MGTVSNDRIDINGEIDVGIKHLKPRVKEELRVEISGKSIDHSVVNAIRRTIMMNIPIYGFNRSNIYVETKKTRYMYNNDMLYNQIEMLPILDVPNYFDLENPEIFLPTELLRRMFSNFIPNKYDSDIAEGHRDTDTDEDSGKKLFKIEFSINYKNNTDDDIFISTHHAVLKIDGKISNAYMNHEPICILVLKPTEELSMRAEANLGMGAIHSAYDATCSVTYDEITNTRFLMWYETLGQLSQHLIFSKACKIIIANLENLGNFLESEYPDDLDKAKPAEITLVGADHTLGNLITTALQKCEYTEIAAYFMPHPSINEIILSYKLHPKSKKKPIRVLLDCCAYLIRIFEALDAKSSPPKAKK